jgi:hypothetical protein
MSMRSRPRNLVSDVYPQGWLADLLGRSADRRSRRAPALELIEHVCQTPRHDRITIASRRLPCLSACAGRIILDAGARWLSHRAARRPSLVLPSEWMTCVWVDESIFDDVDEAQSILNALIIHYNAIGDEPAKGRKQYRPYGRPDDDSERASTETAAEWSFGFWKGMLLRPYDWKSLIRDGARALLAPIL